uniref:Cleavage stimulation factor subunit 3 (Trinotate prediction) n=1 Tax=Myxobolus squamalis TaxID=59785 RepID=A0A6B2FZS5_MYXSQ
MRPYKPLPPNVYANNLPSFIPGGVFPPPYKISEILSQLPPPSCFRGPFIDVDHLIYFISCNIQTISHNPKQPLPYEALESIENPDPKRNNTQILDDLYRYRQEKNISHISN